MFEIKTVTQKYLFILFIINKGASEGINDANKSSAGDRATISARDAEHIYNFFNILARRAEQKHRIAIFVLGVAPNNR